MTPVTIITQIIETQARVIQIIDTVDLIIAITRRRRIVVVVVVMETQQVHSYLVGDLLDLGFFRIKEEEEISLIIGIFFSIFTPC